MNVVIAFLCACGFEFILIAIEKLFGIGWALSFCAGLFYVWMYLILIGREASLKGDFE